MNNLKLQLGLRNSLTSKDITVYILVSNKRIKLIVGIILKNEPDCL